MKRKLLSILLLLCFAVGGAWAEGVELRSGHFFKSLQNENLTEYI